MTEYITKEQARDAIYARIDELKYDKEFNIAKEICVSGVKKHIRNIPPADVIEREKINKVIDRAKRRIKEVADEYDRVGRDKIALGLLYAIEILNDELGE